MRLISKIHNMDNFSDTAKEMLLEAVKRKEEVENSDLFKKNFLAIESFPGETSEWYYKSTQEIYDHYMLGREDVGNREDHCVDYYLVPYYSWKRVVGYTYPSVNTIYLNTRILYNSSLVDIGSNLAHEYCHNIGFDHAFRGASMYSSIPYLVNKVFEQTYAEMYGTGPRQPVLIYVPWYKRVFNYFRGWF